ncbi:hypothetical protein [Serratia marcescens]|jgi:hypothetical protein|uniref:hypothetical protein n=1 Tax=Serratia marcescens TaxID=615 RepID=UPI0029DC56BD|nr:hypothetical protein [Serratia marcescens]MDX7571885.1 hypothetical protein [Serratia marcescens]
MKSKNSAVKILSDIDEYISDYANQSVDSNIHKLLPAWKDMSFEERIAMAQRIDEKDMAESIISDKGTVGGSMITTVLLLRLLGLNNTANRLEFLTHSALMHAQLRETIEDVKIKNAVSVKNSENASGPKNRYHDVVLEIMINTWERYPLASKNGMKEKLIEHFGKDKVSESSIKRWIKENNLGPQREVRPPVSFSLVIGS